MTQLVAHMRGDAMSLRDVQVPTSEVVYFKSLIEAYPGVAAVHATRGAARSEMARLLVATTQELQSELDALLTELTTEIDGLVWNISEQASADRHGG